MGDQSKRIAREKELEEQREYRHRVATGYTVFRNDFHPDAVTRNLTIREAARRLEKQSGFKIYFWRCPERGLGIAYHIPKLTTYLYDSGGLFKLERFSTATDTREAKHELLGFALAGGMQDHRALSNAVFDDQLTALHAILTAGAYVEKAEYMAVKARIQPRIIADLNRHGSAMRRNILDLGPPRRA
jgi:hypothetical protein